MKVAILRREYIIFFMSPTKYSLVPNNEIGAKLPSHSQVSCSDMKLPRVPILEETICY